MARVCRLVPCGSGASRKIMQQIGENSRCSTCRVYAILYLARGAQANPRAEGSTKMAELDMSWVTEYQVVEDTFEKRDMAEFEKFDITLDVTSHDMLSYE